MVGWLIGVGLDLLEEDGPFLRFMRFCFALELDL